MLKVAARYLSVETWVENAFALPACIAPTTNMHGFGKNFADSFPTLDEGSFSGQVTLNSKNAEWKCKSARLGKAGRKIIIESVSPDAAVELGWPEQLRRSLGATARSISSCARLAP